MSDSRDTVSILTVAGECFRCGLAGRAASCSAAIRSLSVQSSRASRWHSLRMAFRWSVSLPENRKTQGTRTRQARINANPMVMVFLLSLLSGVFFAAESIADIEDAVSDAGTGVKVFFVKILEHGFQPVQFIPEGGSGHSGVVFTHFFASEFL